MIRVGCRTILEPPSALLAAMATGRFCSLRDFSSSSVTSSATRSSRCSALKNLFRMLFCDAGTQVATNYNATFYCTEAQMTLLAEHGFGVASIQLGDETVTRVVKEKKASKTKENATCILGD